MMEKQHEFIEFVRKLRNNGDINFEDMMRKGYSLELTLTEMTELFECGIKVNEMIKMKANKKQTEYCYESTRKKNI